MGTEIENEVIERIKISGCYTIQLEETLDFAELAASLAVARYINKNSVEDELLFCKSLKTRTTGEYIFNLVEFHLKENGLPLDKCTDICTAGAKSMTGQHSVQVFIACVNSVLPEIGVSCCIIHRHALIVIQKERLEASKCRQWLCENSEFHKIEA
jgi:hypothetical protein